MNRYRLSVIASLSCVLWLMTETVSAQGPSLNQGPSLIQGQGMLQGSPMIHVPSVRQVPSGILEPNSDTATEAREWLDQQVELGEISTTLGDLGRLLGERLDGLPVLVDARGIKMAELAPGDPVSAKLPPMPLRSALRKMLSPLGLRCEIDNDGLVITADFAVLTRRGLATDRWIGLDDAFTREIERVLGAPYTAEFVDAPLTDVVRVLSRNTGVPILVDGRALEEIGLSIDQPVNMEIKDVPLRSVLHLMLRELDLTYMTNNNVLQITTIEAAEQNLQKRIYWLEGTGMPVGDFQSVIDAIQTSIIPDTWEALGGPSTMAPISVGRGNRPGILIATTYDVHHQIDELLKALRESQVGPDPIVTFTPVGKANQPPGTVAPANLGGGGSF